MVIKGVLNKIPRVFFIIALVFVISLISKNGAFADYVVGDGGNNNGGSCGINAIGNYYHWDTCFGLSWQYYEWPKDGNGNPIDGTISFYCGQAAEDNPIGCKLSQINQAAHTKIAVQSYSGKNYRRVIIDPVKDTDNGAYHSGTECKTSGGFWYLGYQVYSPSKYFYKCGSQTCSTGNTNVQNIGAQVGRPSVDMLYADTNVVTPAYPSAGLFPFGKSANAFNDSGYYPKDITINGVYHAATLHNNINVQLPNSSSDGGYYKKYNNYSNPIQPIISSTSGSATSTTISGTPTVIYAKYLAGTQEVYNIWRSINKSTSETFNSVNWFCAANPDGTVYGEAAVYETNNTSNIKITSWDESSISVNLDNIEVTSENTTSNPKKVTFEHYLKDTGGAIYSISSSDSVPRSSADVTNVRYEVYDNGSARKLLSRTANLVYGNVTDGQSVCDVLTYDNTGQGTTHTRTACFTVKKKALTIAAGDISSSTNMFQNDNTGNSQTATATNATQSSSKELQTVYRIIGSSDQTVTFKFTHAISGSGVAGTSAKDINYTIKRYDGSNWNNIAVNQKTTITIPSGSSSSTNTVRSGASYDVAVGYTTNKQVCENMSASYSGASRYTQTCARVIGNRLTGTSTITQKNNTSNKATASDYTGGGSSQSLSTINVTVTPGTTGSVTLNFAHSMSLSGGVNGVANGVSYKIERRIDNGSWSTISNSSKNLATSSSVPTHTASMDTGDYPVSGITSSTDTTICERLTLTYGGATRTSTVCGRIKGNAYSVSGNSSVGQTSSNMTSTQWGSSNATMSINVHVPYGSSTTKNAYFKHELKTANTVSGSGATVSYQVYRGNNASQDGTAVSGGSGTKTFSGTGGTQTAWEAAVNNHTVTPGNTTTVCQKLQYTYGTSAKTPNACISFVGVAPTFSGSSTVSDNNNSKTVSTNGGSDSIPEIKIKVAAGKTDKRTINFSHKMTATSTLDDAKGKSTGSMAFSIVKSYTTDGSGSFSKTFPSNDRTVTDSVSSSSTDVVVSPGESKNVCEKLSFTGWSSEVCAKVTGELSLPNLQSQSGVSYKGSAKTTTNWENNKTVTAEERRVPVKYSEDNAGGATFTVDFSHEVKTILAELAEQNTGSVPFTVTTSGAINNDAYTGTFGPYTVTTSTPNNIQTIYTTSKDAKVKIGQTVTVCQTLTFTYKGTNYSSTACGKFTGFDATPQGRSVAKFNTLTADTNWVNGELKRITLNTTDLSMDNIESQIVFKHFVRMTGKFNEDIPVTITNSYDSKYNSSLTYKYRGNSDTSYAETDLYGAGGGRPTAISHTDALGMIAAGSVCETLDFTYDGLRHLSTACIDFTNGNYENTGNVNGGTTRSVTTVKKRNINTGNTWSPETGELYAKPTDEISFTHYYYPGAQATRYTSGNESDYNKAANNGKTVLIPPRNAFVENSNNFTIQNRDNTNNFVANSNNWSFSQSGQILTQSGNTFTGIIGNANSTTILTEGTRITANAVGAIGDSAIRQSLYTEYGSNSASGHHTANCGAGCVVTYRNGGDDMWYNYSRNMTYGESSYATVNVPYNYNNTASYDASGSYVYPGDSIITSSTKINVEKRYNSLVGEEYATKTPETTIRLYSFYTEDGGRSEGADRQQDGSNIDACSYYQSQLGYIGCTKIGENTNIFNGSNNLNGITESAGIDESTFNVPDIKAGSKICVGISIYPAGSTDNSPSNGKTYISKAFCRVIAKKPSFQIWGGSLYSAGNVKSYDSKKYLLAGIHTYTPIRDSSQTPHIFGSWVEYGIIANGIVSGVSSGTATGYATSNFGVSADNPGGTTNPDFCNRSRLTFSNTNCLSGTAGQFGSSGGSSSKQTVKQKYATAAAETDDLNNGSLLKLNLSSPSSYTVKDNIRYTYTSGDIAITASSKLSSGVTHVIYAKGSVIIYGNGAPLSYSDSSYTNISDIPQYIIIADGNIHIDSEVTRVDAILVTEGTINTCTSFNTSTNHLQIAGKEVGTNNVTGVYCGKQLRINGAVIADEIKLYRIYGAGTGLNSIIPAEIINYTPSTYVWDSGNASNSKPEIHTTYQHELAPRQ